MLATFDVIIVLFIILVNLYLAVSYQQMNRLDILMISLAIFFLLITWITKPPAMLQTETFAQQTATDALEPILLEEDLTVVAPICKIYATAFHTNSYSGSGKEWTNVSYKEEDKDECPDGSREKLTFENVPSFAPASGFALSSNRLMGPHCNMLGIDVQTPFTIFLTFKNGTFTSNEEEIDILKLYGNSDNNNALSLFVSAKSVDISNGIQTGDLRLMWVDEKKKDNHIVCKLHPDDDSFVFNTTDLTSLFIVRTSDSIRVIYMYGSDGNTINVIGQKALKETVATFSNKEMVINRRRNWKANLFSFGVVNSALSDSNIAQIHRNTHLEYMKANNEEFQRTVTAHNDLIDRIRRSKQCPFDASLCAKCNTITDWTNPMTIFTASLECKQAIQSYCITNPNSPLAMCKCWNPATVDHGTDACKSFRAIFENRTLCNSTLQPDEITCLKERHKLIPVDQCPKENDCSSCPSTKNKLITNDYEDPDYEQMRVNPQFLQGVTPTSRLKVETPYPKESSGDYDASKLLIQQPVYSDTPAPTTKNAENSIVNMYKEDPKANFDQNKNTAVKEFEKSNELAKSSDESFKDKLMNLFFSSK